MGVVAVLSELASLAWWAISVFWDLKVVVADSSTVWSGRAGRVSLLGSFSVETDFKEWCDVFVSLDVRWRDEV